QILILLCIAIPVGLGLGFLIFPMVNQYMYKYLNVTASTTYIPMTAILQTVTTIIVMVVLIAVVVSGYLYRHDIQEYLGSSRPVSTSKKKSLLPPVVYVFLYIVGIVMMFLDEHSATSYVVPTVLGMFGVTGLVEYAIPKIIMKLKQGKMLTKRYALIFASNVSYTIQRSATLVTLTVISVTGMVAILASQQQNPREYITAIVGYMVLIVLLVTTVVYSFCNDVQQRTRMFRNLWNIGYTKKELYILVRNEVLYFYLVLLLLPLIYVLFIGGRFVYFGDMEISLLLMTIVAYIIPMIISSLLTYRVYVKAVINPIKGVE
ncbi:MAG: ABC transporter permease, partial [Coprobacillaceae bacterium]